MIIGIMSFAHMHAKLPWSSDDNNEDTSIKGIMSVNYSIALTLRHQGLSPQKEKNSLLPNTTSS